MAEEKKNELTSWVKQFEQYGSEVKQKSDGATCHAIIKSEVDPGTDRDKSIKEPE